MIEVVVVITTMLLVTLGFTVWIDDWLRLNTIHYNRSVDVFYRIVRVLAWFTCSFVLVDWGWVIVPVSLYIVAFLIRKLWVLSLDK